MSLYRVGSVIRVAPGKASEYQRRHAEVWPAVIDNLAAAHVKNYSIFIHGDLLFSYLEYTGDSYAADMAALAAKPETREWRALMAELQIPLEQAKPGQWWVEMTEVFHFD